MTFKKYNDGERNSDKRSSGPNRSTSNTSNVESNLPSLHESMMNRDKRHRMPRHPTNPIQHDEPVSSQQAEYGPEHPSICIPRVDTWVTDEYVRQVFNEVFLGKKSSTKSPIVAINLIERENERGEKHKRVFIHFDNWERIKSSAAKETRSRLLAGKEVKIMHNTPSYWKCYTSKLPRPGWLKGTAELPKEAERPRSFLIDDSSSSDSDNEDLRRIDNGDKSLQRKYKKRMFPRPPGSYGKGKWSSTSGAMIDDSSASEDSLDESNEGKEGGSKVKGRTYK